MVRNHEEDVPVPEDTDLYQVLGIDNDAPPEQIKSAYRKLALKHHPDKAPSDAKEDAHEKFQQIAFAYAILSDEKRRRRYDLTGNTAEAVEDDDDFDWVDFYREQFSAAVDVGALDKLKAEYQGSAEEEGDILEAYRQAEGDLDRVYESVLLCNVLDDDERFRAVIDKAIADGTVPGYKKYVEETEKKKQLRVKRAQKEAREAEKLSQELDEKKRSQGKKGKKGAGKKGAGSMDDLAAIIQQRQVSRGVGFLDRLEERYGGGGTKRGVDEPPEEAFQANAARSAKKKKGRA
ncbi:DnaJ-domain-containing protein [Aspergillus campestris IBT 28561]|uniref:DnaJ-domain-containing protein n=1 Tax=Aspergillus campestris (strain IBT 28561) TaxID=1392248 RepID=A0A2I1CVH9_ASPC2|nr:DnaJ-domain-containing protein [Aspergillus campestris IBT 28561]PKY01637.1 DnaJ-domain-containing protein [Aspergillus campestris IBT 28561]